MRVFRQSDIGTYLWCRRNFQWTVHQRLAPIWIRTEWGRPPGSADTGTLIHKAVELESLGRPWKQEVRDRALDLANAEKLSKDWESVLSYVEVMMAGYVEWLAEYGADIGVTTIAQEERLWVPMGMHAGEEVVLTGKPDRIRYDEPEDAWVVDDVKTINSGSVESVQVHNRQLLTYAIMLRMLGRPAPKHATTTQLLVSKRTKGGPLTKYYGRSLMYITEEMYNVHYDELTEVLTDMVRLCQRLEAGEERAAIQNPGRDCGWKCNVQELCVTRNYGGHVDHLIENNYRTLEVDEDGR